MTVTEHTHAPIDPARRRWLGTAFAAMLAGCSRSEHPAAVATKASATSAIASDAMRRRAVDAPDIVATAILMPGQVNSSTDGTLIDLVRAIDEVYETGRILIEAVPLARATLSVARGDADMGFPALRLGPAADSELAYRLSTASIGKVSFVLYSNVRKPLTREMVMKAANDPSFPYAIEAPAKAWGFPTRRFTTFESALYKVSVGRIDALLWSHETTDRVLRKLGLRDIHRAHFADFDTVFMLPRTPRGDFVDGVLTTSIEKLRRNGRLKALCAKNYLPYEDWQPGRR